MNKRRSFRSFSSSSYLRKEDFPEPELLTLSGHSIDLVKAPGKEEKEELVIYFREKGKGMITNITNGEVLFDITGSEFPEDWVGARVVIFNDPTVKYAGKRVGGLRLRKPTQEELLAYGEPPPTAPVEGEPVEIPY